MRAAPSQIMKMAVFTGAMLVLLGTLAATAGRHHWFLDLFTHFRVQYAIAGALLTLVLLLMRRWRWSIVPLIAAIANSALVFPWYVKSQHGPAEGAATAPLRVVLSNVFTRNTESQRVLDFIKETSADILVLQEVDRRWRDELRPLDAVLPYSRVHPQQDNFGISVWSRLPLEDAEIIEIGDSEVATIRAKVKVSGTTVEIIATHPLPPVGAWNQSERNHQLATIASFARQATHPVVVIGDLNITMWSPHYADFIRDSGLVNARKGFGVLPTWPTTSPVIKIPLDHCLTSPSIGVKEFRTGPHVGSDHLPIVVDLVVPVVSDGETTTTSN